MSSLKGQLSLHLSLAEKCMNVFEAKKLPLSASVEQVRYDRDARR